MKPDGSWKTQCIVIEGVAFNIAGWERLKKERWLNELPAERTHAYILRRPPGKIPESAVTLTPGQIVSVRNNHWRINAKTARGILFAWITREA